MSRPTLNEIASLSAVSETYRWDMAFTQSRFGVNAGLNLRCASTTLPKKTNEPLEIKVRGQTFKQPGQVNTSGTIEMQFYETVDGHISNFLKQWSDAAWAENTGTGLTNKAIFNELLITLLDRQNNPVWEYALSNVFLEDSDLGSLDSENSAMQPTATLSYSGFTSKRVG